MARWKKRVEKADINHEIHSLKLGSRFMIQVVQNLYIGEMDEVVDEGWYGELCVYEGKRRGRLLLSDPIVETRNAKTMEKAKKYILLEATKILGSALYVLGKES